MHYTRPQQAQTYQISGGGTAVDAQHAELMTTFPMFQDYTARGTQSLIERGQIREFAPGDLLFKAGEPAKSVLLILTGKAKVFVEAEGSEVGLGDAGPSRMLGELAVLGGIRRPASTASAQFSDPREASIDRSSRAPSSGVLTGGRLCFPAASFPRPVFSLPSPRSTKSSTAFFIGESPTSASSAASTPSSLAASARMASRASAPCARSSATAAPGSTQSARGSSTPRSPRRPPRISPRGAGRARRRPWQHSGR